MTHKTWMLALVALSALMLLAPACGDDDDSASSDSDTDTDSDSDSDSDADTDTDTDTDTGPDQGPCDGTCWGPDSEYNDCTCGPSDPCGWADNGTCDEVCVDNGIVTEMFDDSPDCGCYPVAWDEEWTYGDDYAPGPYGFKGSVCYDGGGFICGGSPGEWLEGADHIPNICLNNGLDEEVCLMDYYQSTEYDLLVVDYTAMWCPPCNDEASSEEEFVDYLAADGWNVLFITILGEDSASNNADVNDVNSWATSHDLDPAHILYDANKDWDNGVFGDSWPEELRGWPTNFIVHTSNMLIWDSFSGWIDPDSADFDTWLDCMSGDGLLEDYADNVGAIAE